MFSISCDHNVNQSKAQKNIVHSVLIQEHNIINEEGMTIESRFLVPKGFERVSYGESSFAEYLRELPLKKHGELVRYYDGRTKPNHSVYEAVVDMEIGKRDLHQCADAIMRLRAEYLWKNKRYDEIHFNFTNGFRVDYSQWMQGKRIRVKGNKVWWENATTPSNTYHDFWKYMEIIFSYAGTLSLSKEMIKRDMQNMQIGDVFIQGGLPGHAVIIVDMIIDKTTGEKCFMLAQSYMPAQEIQILKNNSDILNSPWYSIDLGEGLFTPEWVFQKGDLKHF
jgi:hypothetical protein